MKDSLNISIVQCPLFWENKYKNLKNIESLLSDHTASSLYILPEMFTTGFSMNAPLLAENMDGESVTWMRQQSQKRKAIITGSISIEADYKYYNRLIWMQPDGNIGFYDKRHLFSYAGEHEHFTSGNKRLIAQVNGWKICLLICYDLRFPVWSRMQYSNEYDVLIYVANWPSRRAIAWNTLLKARAIENQCYVIGVNRTGSDGNKIEYQGDSQIISPLGEILFHSNKEVEIHHHTLYKKEIESTRTQFPFLNDKDDFVILSD